MVFHAAAYKHVPLMEHNPYEAIKTNIIGSKNVSDISQQYNVNKFIMISTDKAVNPTNIMGASKRIAELYINNLNNNHKTKFITTRFGNVLGSNGSVIPTFLKKINNNENLQLTHKDITRYFMTIPEAAQLVIYSSLIGNGGEILLFDMGEPIKIYELAKRMIELYGNHNIGIDISGLRPGEKLYEELLCDGEKIIKTDNEKIMKLKHVDDTDYINFFNIFEKIINFEFSDINELKKLLKQIVPDYTPSK
jgi:FlaA1/EpsC-like NDP-sugar epimerase